MSDQKNALRNDIEAIELIVSETMLHISGLIKKYKNPTVHPPEMNKELDTLFNDSKKRLTTLLNTAVIDFAEKHSHEQLTEYAETRTCSCFERSKRIYDEMYNEGLKSAQKESKDE